MAMMDEHKPVTTFEDWYERYEVDERSETLDLRFQVAPCGHKLWHSYEHYKREMDSRVGNFEKLEMMADGEVVSKKPDLPNVSSGEAAGLIRRTARNLVQNTPNVEVISVHDDDSLCGIFARHVLTSKIIGSDEYSNDMQQNLFASTKASLTKGFDAVIPVLLQDAGGSWYMKYDTIHYRDVFPEPGAKDIRQATSVFVRRYLTKGEVAMLIEQRATGWDINALRLLLQNNPPAREMQSVDHQSKKTGQIPDGYEIITWYSSTGRPFLTFAANTKLLLRIEQNKHPLKQHPVFFLILEKDENQPLGKSQVELIYGRQEFQDLMLNGAMKLWYRNINPSIIGYGNPSAVPNLSPGKYTSISNPNAKIEAFEVNTQSLMQYGSISQMNLGSMVSMIGAADQQMAQSQGANGQGMSATPQGVEAQNTMVDTTTNNYQKAIESFFSHYCSYALTVYFQELKAVKAVVPTAEARLRLIKAGVKPYAEGEEPGQNYGDFEKDGSLVIDFETLAVEYWVRCIPGSLTELEDEKQLRILNNLFIPLSQAINGIAASGDQQAVQQAVATMTFIVQKQIELSGSTYARDLNTMLQGGDPTGVAETDARIAALEEAGLQRTQDDEVEAETNSQAIIALQQQVSQQSQLLQTLLQKLGVVDQGSAQPTPTNPSESVDQGTAPANASLASA